MNKTIKYLILISSLTSIFSCNDGGGKYVPYTPVEVPLSIVPNSDINIHPGQADVHSLVGDESAGITVGMMGYIVYQIYNNTPTTLTNIKVSSVSNLLDGASWMINSNVQPSCETTPSLEPRATCFYILAYSPKYQGVSGNLPVTISFTYLSQAWESSTTVPFKSRVSYGSIAAKAATRGDELPGFTLEESTTSVPANTKTYILKNNTTLPLFALTMNQSANAESTSIPQFYDNEAYYQYSETLPPSPALDPSRTSTCMSTYWFDQDNDPKYTHNTPQYLNTGIYSSETFSFKLYDKRISLKPGESCSIIVNTNAKSPINRLYVNAIVESGTSYSSNIVTP